MMRMSQKAIKQTEAVDLTCASFEELQALAPHLEKIAYSSSSIFGITAALYRHSATGQLYKVTTRSTAIFTLY